MIKVCPFLTCKNITLPTVFYRKLINYFTRKAAKVRLLLLNANPREKTFLCQTNLTCIQYSLNYGCNSDSVSMLALDRLQYLRRCNYISMVQIS